MSGLYIHIPFCNKRCSYCDFYLITNLDVIEKFLTNLKNEISLSSEFYKQEKFDTIYFGGGTPSLLTKYQIEDLINQLFKYFNLSMSSEISIEANPEDFLNKSMKDYKNAGVNRISFGVQSFVDSELKFLTREHTAEQAEQILNKAQEVFENINLDIIYSLPSQSIADLGYSLSKAIKIGAKHISAYTLTFEEKTPLYKQMKNNTVKKNSDSVESELFTLVSEKLVSEGYNHYEISNFAKEGFESKHNLKYWNYENYIGFGPSSHSFHNNTRWNNFRDIVKYNSLLSKNILPVENKYELSYQQKNLEYIMLSLRSRGVVFHKYEKLFSENFRDKFGPAIDELVRKDFGILTDTSFLLSERGFAVADEIIAKYF